ncbi:carbon-nitrogen family hydrolase [uncultured Fusobacterium sp.]|uniref:carbon-nitrogen family hydrolase n=1 Tax=uncultured Fusobacterium sp. TaxID=159267 RepID=UPI0025F9A026|nr:carbon-nitrogen family hydrolase [uncultured Fusobacterium sp.]
MLNFALLQTDIKFCDTEYNFENVKKLFKKAMEHAPTPDVIVLPEDWSYGFSDKMFHDMENYCEAENGPSVTILKELAKKYKVLVVAGSIATKSHEDGKIRNTTFIINNNGEIIADYSKMHLYSDMDENFMIEPGNKAEVVETEVGKFGFMICYDIRFCELSRIYALKGAEAIIVTSDFPNPRVNHWRTLLQARAIENQIFVIACNRVGESPMGSYCGHSLIIDPWGEIIAEGGEKEEIVYGSVDLSIIHKIRETIHVFRDRHPEFYEKEGLLKKQ